MYKKVKKVINYQNFYLCLEKLITFILYTITQIENYIMKRITRVVCISKYIMNCFAEEGRDMTNDVIIYNYPPTRKHITKDESSLYLNPTSDTLVFGYIGQLNKDKGVHHYIQAALQILKTKNL